MPTPSRLLPLKLIGVFMSYLNVASGNVVASLPGEARAGFIRRTYGHVAASLALLAILEWQMLGLGLGPVAMQFLGGGMMNVLLYIGLFIGASYVANNWAHSNKSKEMQYAGLGLFIFAEAIILLPAMYMAQNIAPNAIGNAAVTTAALVTGLTYICFTTRKDFSFLGPIITIGAFIAIGLAIAAVIFGFNLGLVFSFAIVGLAGAAILYNTSNIMREYGEDQHVAAALALFASIALMFRFLLQIFMSFGDD
ncbi:MAG: FtsH-binding integral membrane protein [Cryomorphaceae bacterium]|jgi:FtsH-binding integral membrane protein